MASLGLKTTHCSSCARRHSAPHASTAAATLFPYRGG
jgi:hypothetical protein